MGNHLFSKISGLLICVFSFISCTGQEHQRNEEFLQLQQTALKSMVLLNNQQGFLPIKDLEKAKTASIGFAFNQQKTLDSLLNKYQLVNSFDFASYATAGSYNALADELKFYNTLILSVSEQTVIDDDFLKFVAQMQVKKQVFMVVLGNGYILPKLEKLNLPIIWNKDNNEAAASLAAQAIYGGIGFNNKLTSTFSPNYPVGAGYLLNKTRLMYSIPEDAGINVSKLNDIDRIAEEAISKRATPGAVVMVVKDGKVIYNKAYGYHTYENLQKVSITDIYDLASVTKISATTLDAMHLIEADSLSLDSNVSAYISKTKKTNKQDIKVREVMLHQAGFIPFIPFYKDLKPTDFSRDSLPGYNVKVADSFYMRNNYFKDLMWPQMINSGLRTRGKYVYSDLSMYFMKEIVEQISGEGLAQYTDKQFYRPLGLQTAGFNPRERFNKNRIVPTELDAYFRKTLLHGYVHDQGASMVGGISGHAGLFANANDLAILYQMLLNKGIYGGKTYFKPQTVDQFTSKQSDVSRRGLGFDRWDADLTKKYPSELASPQTYGHTGYTGTCVWVDPKHNLVYIFLSNRVHPAVSDRLSDLKIRGRIQDAIYKAIEKGI